MWSNVLKDAREQVNNVRMEVSPLWSGPDNIHGFVLDEKSLPTGLGYCSNTNIDRLFRCEDNNVAFTHVQPLYYHMGQEEPCHKLG